MAKIQRFKKLEKWKIQVFSLWMKIKFYLKFIKCITDIKTFVKEVKFRRLINIEETFTNLIEKFDGYMKSMNFSFTI